MASHDAPTEWTQLSLEPPPVLRVTLDVGIIHAADHVQVQIEVRDETSNELISLVSWPHFALSDFDHRFRDIGRKLTEVLREHTGPFAGR